MATKRFWKCPGCRNETKANGLFDALLGVAKGKRHQCSCCETPCDLDLKFDFGLGAKDSHCTVLGCFLPESLQKWPDDNTGQRVTFYPFLVVLHRHPHRKAIWLPYWHLVGDGEAVTKKYGQWAPFMDLTLFNSLVAQARDAGHVLDAL